MKTPTLTLPLLLSSVLLSGCELLGVESVADIRARKHSEAAAIGGACRQASTSLQNCMDENEGAYRAGILEGWRSMDQYIREHPEVQAVGAARAAGSSLSAVPDAPRPGLPVEGAPALPDASVKPLSSDQVTGVALLSATTTPSSRRVSGSVTLDELVASGGVSAEGATTTGSARVPWQLREIAAKREFERRGTHPHGVTRWFGAPAP